MPQDSHYIKTSQEYLDSVNLANYYKARQEKEALFLKEQKEYSDMAFPCTMLLLAFLWLCYKLSGKSNTYVNLATGLPVANDEYTHLDNILPCLIYEGNTLQFHPQELIAILVKRFPYYNSLNGEEQTLFVQRLKKFISRKTFKIHAKSGFKEMPVLISASAIQFSLGLENYLLPNYRYINIYPEEFLGYHPTIRFLEGNVSGNSINLSWKHLLEGIKIVDNGQNVGLHEMAHAYYFQNFECHSTEKFFTDTFTNFEQLGNKTLEIEKLPGNDLYSPYAMTNFQEFWAETVEIFFEKPMQLNILYPDLYQAISHLLNQDPLNHIHYEQSARL